MFYRIILLIVFTFSSSFTIASEEAANNKKSSLVELAQDSNDKSMASLTPNQIGSVAEAVPQEAPDESLSVKSVSPKVGSGILAADPYSVVVGLLGVLALIFGLAWLVRKVGPGAFAGGQSMRVVSVLGVGPREKVLLVDVGGHQILLGVAPGRVTHLRDFEEPVIDENSAPGGEFSAKLKHLLRQGSAPDKDGVGSSVSKTAADVSSSSSKLDGGAGT
jgi:flagellar protein FliO/FliZ